MERLELVNRKYGVFNYRPMFLAAFGFACGILAIMLSGSMLICISISCCAIAISAFIKKQNVALILSLFVLLGLCRICTTSPTSYNLDSKYQTVTGQIYAIRDDDIVLRNVDVNGTSVEGKLLLKGISVESFKFRTDDIIRFTTTLEQTSKIKGTSYKFYLLSEDYTFVARSAYSITVRGHKNTLNGFFSMIHNAISDKCDQLFGDNASVFKGVLLGDTSELPEDTMGNLRDSGIIHLFALSGLHVAIFTKLLGVLLSKVERKLRFGIISIILIMYCAITAFPASLVRATLMSIIMMLSLLLKRKNDSLSALSASMLIILMINPYQLFAAGFVLSFCAVAGILLVSSSFSNMLGIVFGKNSKLTNSMAVSISATSGVMPAISAYFHKMPLYSLITNVIAIPVATVGIVLGFIAVIASFMSITVALPIGKLASVAFTSVLSIASIVAKIPFAVLSVNSFILPCGILYFMRMVAISPYYIANPGHKLRSSITLTLLTFATFLI